MKYSKEDIEIINNNPFLRKGEAQIIKDIMLMLPKNPSILEIGTFKGKTAILMAKTRPDSNIITIDPHYGIPDHQEISSSFEAVIKNIISENLLHQIIHIKTNSQLYTPTKKFDLIFIDGGHTYNDVKHDFEKFKHYCKEEGIIAFHDYGIYHTAIIGVTKFCDSINVKKQIGGTICFFKKNQIEENLVENKDGN